MAIQKKDETVEVINSGLTGFIIEYRRALTVAGVLLAVLVIILGFFMQNRNKTQESKRGIVYDYSQTTLKDFREQKLSSEEMMSKTRELVNKIGSLDTLFPILLEASDLLAQNQKIDESLEVIKLMKDVAPMKDPVVGYMVGIREAVILEDLKKNKEAISILENLTKSPVKIIEGKLYLDLGRLYLKEGQNKDAEINFKYVIEKVKDTTFSRVAKIYLEEMGVVLDDAPKAN